MFDPKASGDGRNRVAIFADQPAVLAIDEPPGCAGADLELGPLVIAIVFMTYVETPVLA